MIASQQPIDKVLDALREHGCDPKRSGEGWSFSVPTARIAEPPAFDLQAVFPPGATYARDYVAELSRSTQTPAEMAALLGLAVASACVCGIAVIRGHGDHVEPPPIWGLALSEPATRKSAVLSALCKPVFDWEADEARRLGPVLAEAQQRRRMEEKRLRKMEDEAARASDQANRLRAEAEAIELARDIEANPIPKPPSLVTSEPTPEAMLRTMAENHGRTLLASAEGDALDIVQGRYSGSRNYGALLKGHAGDSVRVHRVGREPDIIDRPCVAVALCVQRAAVDDLWSDPQAEGRGLLARFAVIAPPDGVGSRDVRPKPMDPAKREAWRDAIRRLLSFAPPTPDEGEPVAVCLSPEADVLFFDFQKRVERELGHGGDLADRRGWGGKLCGLALRIALTLHALSSWARSGSPSDARTVDENTMAAAIAWADYLAEAERHARSNITASAEDRKHARILEWIEGRGRSVTVRDVTKGLREYRGKTDEAQAALEALAEAGFGTFGPERPGKKGGAPAMRFRLHDPGPKTPSGDGKSGGSGTGAAAGEGWGEV